MIYGWVKYVDMTFGGLSIVVIKIMRVGFSLVGVDVSKMIS